jgi:ketosteroid isomerase-like protein
MSCILHRASLTCGLGLLLAAAGACAANPASDNDLSGLLKRQTQEFSEAGQRGDKSVLARYLDDAVVFTNETGEIVTKQQLLADAKPLPGDRQIEVTHWSLTPQGNVATATFIDVVHLKVQDQMLEYGFQSTETWARRGNGWRMIASHTMVVPHDPPAVTLTSTELDQYVGAYELGSALRAQITRDGDTLMLSSNGGPAMPLKVELRDVLFTPGDPYARRIFQRDATGSVTGYISRRSGNDLHFRKVG